jgi:hypothetical protein
VFAAILACQAPGILAKESAMLLSEEMLCNGSPECPKCQGRKKVRMHRHGSYISKRRGGKSIERFCCPRCGLTCTVLPVGMVPYRSSGVKELEDYLDQHLAIEAVTGAVRKPRILERALRDLGSRRQRLCDVFGQMISPANTTVEKIWRHLRKTIGSLEAILRMLHGKFRTSLFRDYRCLNV